MANRRKRRTRQHVIADIGAKHVEYLAAKAGFTTVSAPQGADYGIDITLNTFDVDGYIENEDVKIQVKASERLQPLRKSGAFAYHISKKDLHYWLHEVFPVILVLFDASGEVAHWEYVQRYFGSLRGFSLSRVKLGATIHISPRQILTVATVKEFAKLKKIVVGQVRRKVRRV